MAAENTLNNLKTSLSDKLKGLSKHEVWGVAKPWLESAARTAGVKSLYDVPEYFREKFELKGLKIGKKEFGGGLAETTAALLEQNKAAKNKPDTGQTSRSELFKQLDQLEKGGGSGGEDYQAIERQLEESRPTAVREKINQLNRKLALTKEGDQKGSEARKEMARLLRENRRAEKIDREAIKAEVTTVLDDYTNQKVDGLTAARETIRTALMVSGAQGLMTASNVALDAADFVKKSAQSARREGREFNTKALAGRFAKQARSNWTKFKGTGDEDGGTSSDRWKNRAAMLAQLAQSASKYGVGGNQAADIGRLTQAVVANSNPNFTRQTATTIPESPTGENSDNFNTNLLQPNPNKQTDQNTPDSPNKQVTKSSTANNRQTYPSSGEQSLAQKLDVEPETSIDSSSSEGKLTSLEQSSKVTADDPVYTTRRQTPDRTDLLPKNKGVRNVRTEMRGPIMPGHPTNQPFNPTKPDIAKQFRDSYAERVIQSPTLDERPLPNQPPKDQTRTAQAEYAEQPAGLVRPGARTVVMRRRLQKKGGKKASPLARLRVTGVNFAILAWGGFLWITFQVPFAIFNILLFGIAAAISAMTVADPNDGVFISGVKLVVSGVVGVIKSVGDAVKAVTGIDITVVNPGTFWLLTEVLLICYGIFILLVIFLQYKLAFLRPLSGRATGMKFGAVLLAIIGYSVPVLNLFPWFMVWTIIVWIHPK